MKRVALREYGEGEHVVAYRDRLYRFTDANDEEDQALAAEAAEFLGVDLGDDEDAWGLMSAVREQKQEVLVGRVEDGDLLVEADDWRHGRGSRLLRGVLRHLGLSGVRVHYDGDVVEDIPVGEVTGRLPDALLHGTSSANMGGILRRGLAADETRSNYELHDIRHADTVFLTDNPFKAAHHAENACQPMGRGSWTSRRVAPSSAFPVIVEFAIPDKSKLVPDWDIDVWSEKGDAYEGSREMRRRLRGFGNPVTQEDPFKLSRKFGVFGYRGRIPPAFIRSIRILTGDREENFSPEGWTEVTREQLERAIEYGEPGAWEWPDTCPECGADEGDCECERCGECGEKECECEEDAAAELAYARRFGASAFWRARRAVVSAVPEDFDAEYYMGEACAYFAIALHELYGYRIRMLVDEGVEEGGLPTVAHVYAVDPDGDAVDARGRRSEADVRAEYWDLIEPYAYDISPGELEEDWMGDDKPLHGPSSAEVEEARLVVLAAPEPWAFGPPLPDPAEQRLEARPGGADLDAPVASHLGDRGADEHRSQQRVHAERRRR